MWRLSIEVADVCVRFILAVLPAGNAPRRILSIVFALAIAEFCFGAPAEKKTDSQPATRWKNHVFLVIGEPTLHKVETPVTESSVYGAASAILQLSPTQAGLVCGVRQVGIPVVDLGGGSDFIPFDSIQGITEKNAVPLLRNQKVVHPRNKAPLVMVCNHMTCGFVPLGAKLDDGSPHPAAGTGFGLMVTLGFPPDHSELWAAANKDIHSMLRLQQYRYDGKNFKVISDKNLDLTGLVPDWEISNVSLDNPMPDGQDLLTPVLARGGKTQTKKGCAMTRWRYANGEWKPVNIYYVAGSEGSFEPCAVRDRNGAILLSVRRGTEFNIWRSVDHGENWKQLFHLDKMCAASPVTLHRTLGGQPFLCANPYVGPYRDGRGQEVPVARWRESVSFWPLNDDRTGVEKPSFNFDFCRARFGSSPNGSATWGDHPTSGIVRLADEKPHALLCLRVWSRDEVNNGVLNTPLTGTWIREINNLNDGQPIPVWKF